MAEQLSGPVEVLSGSTVVTELDNGTITAGGNGRFSRLNLNDGDGERRIYLETALGAAIIITDEAGTNIFSFLGLNGNLTVGGKGRDGSILIRNLSGQDSIEFSGETGDIVLRNADCAEDFDVADSEGLEPGTTMVIGEEARLQQSSQAYDRKVVGVVAGAGEYRPGIILGRRGSSQPRVPLTVLGKTYCKVDAGPAAINIGDLLTTSPRPGHAMTANDPSRAFGAVIGKALGSQSKGVGLIPILVALQ